MRLPTPIALARLTTFASILFIAATSASQAQIYRYVVTHATVTDLGTLGGAQSWGHDINAHGNVVGTAETAGGVPRGFIHSAGTMYDVNHQAPCARSEARGINYHDQVVGTCWLPDNTGHAYRWASGVMSLLHDASPHEIPVESNAVATSDSGYIVGVRNERWEAQSVRHATLWNSNDTYLQLHPSEYGSWSRVSDVNQYGVAIGYEHYSERPRRWRPQWPGFVADRIPGAPGFHDDLVELRGINASGQIVGSGECEWYFMTANCRAWYWDGVSESSTDLGFMPTGTYAIADDINDGGFIAGYGDRVEPGMPPFVDPYAVDAGFLYHPDFGWYVLPALPHEVWWLVADCRAYALNDRRRNGQIQLAGHCHTATGAHAVRWDVTVALQRVTVSWK